ncbi:unnamed protein product [Bemisia tabaci]|uniref:Uncharacterized protein n=1 Tax=Bemisia tabaci TaxID=7038 RepID=A0A9P0F9R4_BEMTA|nr:unnamed protein product [Bemisia tabaci]
MIWIATISITVVVNILIPSSGTSLVTLNFYNDTGAVKYFLDDINLANLPYKFIDRDILRKAIFRAERGLSVSRTCINGNKNSKTVDEQERKLSYFREDVVLNLHHSIWHIIHPVDPHNGSLVPTHSDRRGELFGYMHSQLLARYNFARINERMSEVSPLEDLQDRLPGFYNPMVDYSQGVPYTAREEGAVIKDFIYDETDGTRSKVTVEKLQLYMERIQNSIKSNTLNINGTEIRESNNEYIDILGNIVEACSKTVNREYYGNLHNYIHRAISFANGPDGVKQAGMGVIGDTNTAVRDPIFYRLHATTERLFRQHKDLLSPYSVEELSFDGVFLTDVIIKPAQVNHRISKSFGDNVLVTFWEESIIDITKGMSFGPTFPINVCHRHLQHVPFSYEITVENYTGKPLKGTARIFMAPTNDGMDTYLNFEKQRKLFVEMDKFVVNLKPGVNYIKRESLTSTVASPANLTLHFPPNPSMEWTAEQKLELTRVVYRGCGWPHHLLIPKGRSDGLGAHLFVMISDYGRDKVKELADVDHESGNSLCGLNGKLYPDRRPMGFPFDRRAKAYDIFDFLTPNMIVKIVNITHVE